jgi:hypothetical protein
MQQRPSKLCNVFHEYILIDAAYFMCYGTTGVPQNHLGLSNIKLVPLL